MQTDDGVEVYPGMQVFVYPGDSVIGGTIVTRIVGGTEGEYKILYDKTDSEGMIGCRRNCVFAHYKSAEAKQKYDRENE